MNREAAKAVVIALTLSLLTGCLPSGGLERAGLFPVDNVGSRSAVESVSSEQNTAAAVPKYNNTLNIGELEIADLTGVVFYGQYLPVTFEMSRDDVLEYFGLSADLDLSGIAPELHETAPMGIINQGKHGIPSYQYMDADGNECWEPVRHHQDSDEFWFESADGSQSAKVIFQRRYGDTKHVYEDRICSDIITLLEDGSYSTETFYGLPTSTVAGVEMRIAKKSTGGYYAEFGTDRLYVGLITRGLSEEKTVAALEYLAEYVGAA
ncbi:MAG: hypothetical protein NC299_13080 [Lachnospiraceae bacterium]|nr:hypothetical protein [Ruminococcus sp.]MCM1275604.1 hypothetical protein [Lachnospiraceae bacterium]MCM1276271.1 hypothetical protein [Lachnospiraceae bacterium]